MFSNKKFQKKHYLYFSIFFGSLLFLVAIYGIFPVPKSHTPFSSQHQTQEKFDAYTTSLFASNLSGDTLSMHFYVANTSNYFQMDFPQTFGSFSYQDMRDSQSQYIKQIQTLKTFNYHDLTKSQKITYDILLSYYQTELDFGDLCTPFECISPTTGIQAQLPILLSEYAFYTKKDIDNYLSLLSKMPEYFDHIISFEQEKLSNGTFMSSRNCNEIIAQCLSFIGNRSSEENLLAKTFSSRINSCDFLSQAQKENYCIKNKQYITDYVIPSYDALVAQLTNFNNKNTTDNANSEYTLAHSKEGKAYYEYLVRSKVGTSKSIPELKSAIQSQIASDMKQVATLFTSNPDLETSFYSPSVSKLSDPIDILSELQTKISDPDSAFHSVSKLGKISYDLKYVEDSLQDFLSPAFYLSPPIDLPSQHVIYVNQGSKFKNQDLYTTLAHEGFPGHLYQNYIFSHTNPPAIRQLINFGGYTEGWATYAEFLSYSYETNDELLANALSCSASFSLGLYSLVDIGVNYEGWSTSDALVVLKDYGFSDEAICQEIYDSVTESPANYLQYYAGYLEIKELRDAYLKTHPGKDALCQFHKFILEFGPAPFDVIRKWMPKD